MRSTESVMREIELLVRARYPILYVVSSEEQRVCQALVQLGKRRNKRLYEWSFTTGIVPAGTSLQSRETRNSSTKDPMSALDHVIDHVEPAIYLFKDFHPFLTKNNFAVIRRLREVAYELKNSYKTLVLISPVVELPAELEKEVTVIDFPLPDTQDLSKVFDQILQEVKNRPNIKVELPAESREKLLKAALGLTLGEAENVFAKTLVNDGKLTEQDINAVFSEKRQIIRKSGLLDYYETDVRFEHVGGLDLLKEWLRKRALAFADKARAFGLPAPKGVFLLGVQGCGKSLCAKAVAGLWHMPLLRLDVGRMFGSLVGSSEENMRHAIRIAESVSPAILWVDEIEKALSGSTASGFTDAGTTARVFGTFLTWLSEKTAPVFVIATANSISQLPPELLRKGRFDEIFFVDLPGPAEREEILRIHIARRGRQPETFDLKTLAAASIGFSGAEIEESVISALFDAFAEGKDLNTSGILKAIKETVPLSRTMQEEMSHLRMWSEGRARDASTPQEESPGAQVHARKIEL